MKSSFLTNNLLAGSKLFGYQAVVEKKPIGRVQKPFTSRCNGGKTPDKYEQVFSLKIFTLIFSNNFQVSGMDNDFRDMLGLNEAEQSVKTNSSHLESILNDEKRKKPKKVSKLPAPNQFKKPEGMARELFNLLRDGSTGSIGGNAYGNSAAMMDKSPLIQTDLKQGYKLTKAKMSKFQPRAWKLTPFTIPMRDDGIVFFHWRRNCDDTREYPFARFNKHIDNPSYTSVEYDQYLVDPNWTKEETDYFMDLCNQFDTRFIVIQDRYDTEKYKYRSIEDLKERYYGIVSTLEHVRSSSNGEPPKIYDAAHERKRKEQLEKLWNRSREEVLEEERLIDELKRIESRKREREKKAQDLQKLISAVDNRPGLNRCSSISASKTTKMMSKDLSKRSTTVINPTAPVPKIITDLTSGIKWPELKSTGASSRSHYMKLPANLGNKKSKALEQLLVEYGLEVWPKAASEEIVLEFNELRDELAILYELKQIEEAIDFELQTLTHRLNSFKK